jgi:MFS family permease
MRFDNTTKVVLIAFFSRLYFIHINALYLHSRGLSLLEINSIESIIIAAIFLAEVPTGIIADRVGRKWSVVVALLCQTTGEFLYLFGETYAAFALIAILAGVGFAFASGATESLVYDTLPLEDREQAMKHAMGNIGSAGQLGFFLAPLIGGMVASSMAMDRFLLVIFMTACSVLVAFLISLMLHEPAQSQPSESPSTLAIFRSGLSELCNNRRLQHITLLIVFTATFGGSLLTFSQPYLIDHGVSTFVIGVALAAGSLLATLAQKYVYLLESVLGKRGGVFVAAILPGVLYMFLAAASGAVIIFLLIVFTYGVNELRKPLFSAYQNKLIASRHRATMLSLMNMFTSMYVAVMSIAYGALADRSIPLAFLAIGAVIVAAAVLLRVDKLPTEEG